jgi:hypothetical protein
MFGFRQIVESNGAQVAGQQLAEIAEKDQLSIEDWGLRELHEAFMPSDMDNFLSTKSGFQHVTEAGSAVASTAFSNIIGVLLTNEIIKAYNSVPMIGDKLVQVYKSREKSERVPGFTAHNADDDDVLENQEYPAYGFRDKWVGVPDPEKKGKIIYLSEDTIFFDRTGQVVMHAQYLGRRIAEAKEKRILSGVLGGHQCYAPNGILTNLYAGAPQLVGTNALVDWKNIEKAEIEGFDAMLDEEGEKIHVMPNVIIVPRALYRTAKMILRATSVKSVTGTGAVETLASSPIDPGELMPLTSPLVGTFAGAATTWFMGDPKAQFRWKEVYPIQTFRLATNNLLEFQRDVKYAFKVRHRGDIFAIDNKYMVKCTA